MVACLLGMGSKEVVASAPLLLLYDRTFVSGTFPAAWQRHRGTHLMLGATWIVLLVLVLGTGGRGGTALVVAGALVTYRVIGFKAVATVGRNRAYRSEEVLWRDTAGKHPVNARAHDNLGQARLAADRGAEAEKHFARAR